MRRRVLLRDAVPAGWRTGRNRAVQLGTDRHIPDVGVFASSSTCRHCATRSPTDAGSGA
jgi:hypothetical protein